MLDELTITAHHEAAHAVVAALTPSLSGRIRHFWIGPTPPTGGGTYLPEGDPALGDGAFYARLRMLGAGAVGQVLLGVDSRGCESDARKMVELLALHARARKAEGRPLKRRDADRLLDRALAGAHFVVAANWSAVEAVARVLLCVGTIGGDFVRDLVRDTPTTRNRLPDTPAELARLLARGAGDPDCDHARKALARAA